ncbi:carboxymuconolactone decarboxylase family protein [Desulfitobacterium sp. THU1]|uniref:carboxymuconolactone decarboxylase family protein n=1 Tax=Desulfitobacterium sp. THU1 TaxID=3138072 RepID=UPI00311E8275
MALPPFLRPLEAYDPILAQEIEKIVSLSFQKSTLDERTRILITLALDAALGASEGVANLAGQARRLGVSDQEIADTLRLAYFTSGCSTLTTSFAAFEKKE